MFIAIASDHGGVRLKECLVSKLKETGYHILDMGVHSTESVDYPDYSHYVCEAVASGEAVYGFLICTTGVGMSMAANKENGIRAALVMNEEMAEYSRKHNNANVCCFGQKFMTPYMADKCAQIFLSTDFEGGRHGRRINKFNS